MGLADALNARMYSDCDHWKSANRSQMPPLPCCVRLGPRLGLGGSAADTLGLGALKVGCGNPALIVCIGARGDCRTVCTDHRDLVSGIDLLGAA